MNIGLKFPLGSVKEKIRSYAAPYPWVTEFIFGRQGKIAFLASAAFVIIGIGYGQFYGPMSSKLERVQKRLEQTAKKITDLKNAFPDVVKEQKMLEEKDKSLENIRERLRQEEKRLPMRTELDQVLAQITNASGGPSVSIVSVKPAGEKKKTPGKKSAEEVSFYPVETFEVELLSRFWDLLGYLSRLEQVSPYFSFPLLMVDAVKTKTAYPLIRLHVATLLREDAIAGDRTQEIFDREIEPLKRQIEEKDPFGTAAKALDSDTANQKFRLSGIIWRGGEKVAIINNEALREGDHLGSATLQSISDDKVVLKENGFQHELTIST
ncbi:MAG: type 4a pilus biogenesis protein PilO [Candidatus Omnitrophica bacterium]|nr:type 4a pilus biogenesis protein PilO [Candidatus Omnitrophota bacterium]